ncbi:hypothetical protein D3C77_418250 [compost metagenome]
MINITVRFGVGIRVLADRITNRAWTKQRQHHVRPAGDAPVTEGLAKVLIIALQAHLGAYIEETGQAEGGVDDQASGVDASSVRLELQHVVGQVGDITQVEEHVVDTIFQKLGSDGLVPFCQRLEGVGIDGIVEGEDRPVDALPRVFFSSCLGCAQWRQQQAGADTGPGHPIDHACTDPTHRVTPRRSLHRTSRVLR